MIFLGHFKSPQNATVEIVSLISGCDSFRVPRPSRIDCANKDLDGYLGPLGKFIEYCRIIALLPVIPLGIRNNW